MEVVQVECDPGTLIAGRYRIESLLGEGGMAKVYRAYDLAQRKEVALKLLRRELSLNDEAMQRFSREGELLRTRLQHPTIIAADTYGALEDGSLFMVMELLDGETLGALVRREGRLSPMTVAPILTGLCAGLQFAHSQGVLHRDLKPDNVFLVHGNEDADVRVKILDFGISKITGAEKLTQTGQVVGTPRYMAPEQLTGEELDVRVDIYALGIILYEVLAGTPPFTGLSPSELIVAILRGTPTPLRVARPDLPPGLDAIVMRAFAKSRAARFESVVELANAFVSAVAPAIPIHGRVEASHDTPHDTRALGSMTDTLLVRQRKPSGPPLEAGTFEHYAKANEGASMKSNSPRAFAATESSLAPPALSTRKDTEPSHEPMASPPSPAPNLPVTRASTVHEEPAVAPRKRTKPATPRSVGRQHEPKGAAPRQGEPSPNRQATSTDELIAQVGLAASSPRSSSTLMIIVLAAIAGASFAVWAAFKIFG